jgi:hypothetical protein
MTAAAVQIVFLPVPTAGSNSGWDRSRGRPPSWQPKPWSDRRTAWSKRQDIPHQPDHRDQIRRLIDLAREHISDNRSTIKAALLAA